MLTVPEAARRAGRNPETIRRWIREGKLPSRKVGTQHVINDDDLLLAIEGSRSGSGRLGPHRVGESVAPYETPSMRITPAVPAGTDLWLTQIVGRIARAIDPVRIILFGSRARGDQRPDSDYDLLVILDHVDDRRASRIEIRGLLDDLPISKDVIVAEVGELDDPENPPFGALHWALLEGTTIYERR